MPRKKNQPQSPGGSYRAPDPTQTYTDTTHNLSPANPAQPVTGVTTRLTPSPASQPQSQNAVSTPSAADLLPPIFRQGYTWHNPANEKAFMELYELLILSVATGLGNQREQHLAGIKDLLQKDLAEQFVYCVGFESGFQGFCHRETQFKAIWTGILGIDDVSWRIMHPYEYEDPSIPIPAKIMQTMLWINKYTPKPDHVWFVVECREQPSKYGSTFYTYGTNVLCVNYDRWLCAVAWWTAPEKRLPMKGVSKFGALSILPKK